jgi:hypothetical protein
MNTNGSLPVWVIRTWHVSALLTAVLIGLLAWSARQTARASAATARTSAATETAVLEAVVELRSMNSLFGQALRRADSLRAVLRDSLGR